MALRPRQQRFVQEYLVDLNATQAAIRAGYSAKTAGVIGAQNLKKLNIAKAIAKSQEKRRGRVEINQDRVLSELAKIAFSDIRRAVEWHGHLTREEDNPDGGDVLVVKHVFSNHVRLIDSGEIDDDTAAAVAEVRQSPTGGLSIKLHDKQAALVSLGRHLNMFAERVEHTGPDGGPVMHYLISEKPMTEEEWIRERATVIDVTPERKEDH